MEILKIQLTKENVLRYLNENSEIFIPSLIPRIDLEEYAEKISKYATHFSVHYNNEIIGLMACYFNHPQKEIGYITSISVIKKFQNKGIAIRLLEECIHYAKSQNYKMLRLRVFRQNLPAIELYHKKNFFISEKKKTTYYMDLIL